MYILFNLKRGFLFFILEDKDSEAEKSPEKLFPFTQVVTSPYIESKRKACTFPTSINGMVKILSCRGSKLG